MPLRGVDMWHSRLNLLLFVRVELAPVQRSLCWNIPLDYLLVFPVHQRRAFTICGLLEAGYRAEVLQDAVSSRQSMHKRIGLQRMQQSGADISCVEMALFALLTHCDQPEFKSVLQLIKSLPVMIESEHIDCP